MGVPRLIVWGSDSESGGVEFAVDASEVVHLMRDKNRLNLVYRNSSESFVIVLPDEGVAAAVANRIRDAMMGRA